MQDLTEELVEREHCRRAFGVRADVRRTRMTQSGARTPPRGEPTRTSRCSGPGRAGRWRLECSDGARIRRQKRDQCIPHLAHASGLLCAHPHLSSRLDMVVAVVKEEKPLSSHTDRTNHVLEHFRIGFHHPQLVRHKGPVEVVDNPPTVEMPLPVHRVSVAQASHPDDPVKAPHQVDRSLKWPGGPSRKVIDELGGCEIESPFPYNTFAKGVDIAPATFEVLHPPRCNPFLSAAPDHPLPQTVRLAVEARRSSSARRQRRTRLRRVPAGGSRSRWPHQDRIAERRNNPLPRIGDADWATGRMLPETLMPLSALGIMPMTGELVPTRL